MALIVPRETALKLAIRRGAEHALNVPLASPFRYSANVSKSSGTWSFPEKKRDPSSV